MPIKKTVREQVAHSGKKILPVPKSVKPMIEPEKAKKEPLIEPVLPDKKKKFLKG
jgi:hypothetical protein